MKAILFLSCAALTIGIASAQAPSITSVVNAASGIVPGLPNAGIAQGSIFLIVGKNMGPANLSIDHAPFTSNSLLGTSASITVGGTAVRMLMYYTSATQVAGLLPSNTPLGTGTITVTYNNVASAPVPITVVRNNLGIFTITSDGTGAGIVTFPDYSLVSSFRAPNCGGPSTTCGAANPGDVLILWATGLGPVSGSDSSTSQLGVNMPNIPLKLWLGGVQASVSYQGRSGCCIGEDQIVFTVPNNAPLGCSVPLAVQINDQISNYTVIPIATGSRTCNPATPYLSGAPLQLVATGLPVTYAQIKLNRRPNNNLSGSQDNGDARFLKVSVPSALQPFAASLIDELPVGTCGVLNSLANKDLPFTFLGGPDAGPSITVNGANGMRTLTKDTAPGPTDYFAVLGPGNYLSPGVITITGPGGPDIGAFSAAITIPQPPVWTNQASLSTINRANGFTVNWTGGAAFQYIAILGASATNANFTNGAAFICLAPAGAGSFTVPPNVLQALPAGPNGFVIFEPTVQPTTFTASGLGLGFVTSNADTTILATYQ